MMSQACDWPGWWVGYMIAVDDVSGASEGARWVGYVSGACKWGIWMGHVSGEGEWGACDWGM